MEKLLLFDDMNIDVAYLPSSTNQNNAIQYNYFQSKLDLLQKEMIAMKQQYEDIVKKAKNFNLGGTKLLPFPNNIQL
jgi:hypothetical protein